MHQIAKVSGKNQTTIPASVRRALGLRAGDRVVFEVRSDPVTVVLLRRYPTLEEVAGTVPVPPEVRGLDWAEIRARAWSASEGVWSPRADP